MYFYFFKNIFDISTLKWSKNTKIILIWRKKIKKLSNFFKNTFKTQKQTIFYKTQLKKHEKTAL